MRGSWKYFTMALAMAHLAAFACETIPPPRVLTRTSICLASFPISNSGSSISKRRYLFSIDVMRLPLILITPVPGVIMQRALDVFLVALVNIALIVVELTYFTLSFPNRVFAMVRPLTLY